MQILLYNSNKQQQTVMGMLIPWNAMMLISSDVTVLHPEADGNIENINSDDTQWRATDASLSNFNILTHHDHH
ncbi:hypothetical protein ACVBEG_27785 [Pseudomonas sp. GG8]